MVLDHEPGPVVAAALLIGEGGEYDVAGRAVSGARRVEQRRHHHRDHPLHVHGTAAPQDALVDLGCEGIALPTLCGGRNDVDVAVQQERLGFAFPTQPRDEVWPLRVERTNGHVEPRAGQLVV